MQEANRRFPGIIWGMATESMTTTLLAQEGASRRRLNWAERHKKLLADGALAGITLVWGTSFVLVRDVMEQVSPMLWLAVRFGLAAVALALITALLGRWRGIS